MALTKKQLDDPKRWAINDAFHDACLWGVLHGVFDLKADAKAMKAFHKNDLAMVKSITEKRIKAVGSRPKFKKVPLSKRGMQAQEVKGSQAYALMLYHHKLFGKPKKPKWVESEKKKKKPKPVIRERPEIGKANPSLPQNNAYAQARTKTKPNEILLYIVHNEGPSYSASYYNTKTKKRRKLSITAKSKSPVLPWIEQMNRYRAEVEEYKRKKDAKRKPVKAKPKKKKTRRQQNEN